MAIIKNLRGFVPQFGESCFLAETAVIIGDVIVGDNCSIWYGAVLRGDVNSIRIGSRVNIGWGGDTYPL
jgi:carbonic anhydrase/acetyltransferase-like protein (isoleucine patch superfamily)